MESIRGHEGLSVFAARANQRNVRARVQPWRTGLGDPIHSEATADCTGQTKWVEDALAREVSQERLSQTKRRKTSRGMSLPDAPRSLC